MSTTPIATAAGTARQRLATSLSTLQQDPRVPPAVMDIVAGVARAMGPLFQVERGTGSPQLLFHARTALQDTLSRMQTVDQAYPGVSDATAAIASSLGTIFTTIRDHALVEDGPAAQPPPPAPPAPAPRTPPVADPFGSTVPDPVPLVHPAAQPMPLVQQAPAAMPLVQHAAPPVQPPVQNPPVQPPPAAPAVVPAVTSSPPGRGASQGERRPRPVTVFPETAAKVPQGPNGLPRLEAEVDVHSETNFYTNFFGDIRDHGGIFIETYSALAVGSPCEVVITFPGALQAQIRGVVRWRRDPTDEASVAPGLGVEIAQADDETWRLIKRYMDKREAIIHDV